MRMYGGVESCNASYFAWSSLQLEVVPLMLCFFGCVD